MPHLGGAVARASVAEQGAHHAVGQGVPVFQGAGGHQAVEPGAGQVVHRAEYQGQHQGGAAGQGAGFRPAVQPVTQGGEIASVGVAQLLQSSVECEAARLD